MSLPACCTDFEILYPKLFFELYRTADDRAFLEAHGIDQETLSTLKESAVDVDDLTIRIKHRCKQLGDDGLCKIYESRPNVCRGFDCRSRNDCDCNGKGRIGVQV